MSEKGLLTKEMEQFWSELILEKIKLTGWKAVIAKFGLPLTIKTIDDNFGEKVPEPWKSWATQLTTSVYLAVQDGVISDEEIAGITDLAAYVINEKVDIPGVPEETELLLFQSSLKTLAAFALALIVQKKAEAIEE